MKRLRSPIGSAGFVSSRNFRLIDRADRPAVPAIAAMRLLPATREQARPESDGAFAARRADAGAADASATWFAGFGVGASGTFRQSPGERGCTRARALGYGAPMKTLPILYSFRRCPYAMRARMALIASGLLYEHREILLSDKPPAILSASPKGTVPVLVLADGRVIDESIDIMRWALGQNDPEGWMTGADLALVATYDGAFKHHLDRYKYATRYGEDPLPHRAAGLAMLIELEARLASGTYFGGALRGFCDISIFPFVRQFAGVDPAWFEAYAPQKVGRWLLALVGSELFERAMVRLPPWAESDG